MPRRRHMRLVCLALRHAQRSVRIRSRDRLPDRHRGGQVGYHIVMSNRAKGPLKGPLLWLGLCLFPLATSAAADAPIEPARDKLLLLSDGKAHYIAVRPFEF